MMVSSDQPLNNPKMKPFLCQANCVEQPLLPNIFRSFITIVKETAAKNAGLEGQILGVILITTPSTQRNNEAAQNGHFPWSTPISASLAFLLSV